MVNIELLQDAIKDSGMTVLAVCEKAGISKQTLYNRYKNPKFTVDEVLGLKQALRLTSGEVNKIFLS